MKNFVSGSVCIALALICSTAPLGAQQQPAAPPQTAAPAQAQPPEPEPVPETTPTETGVTSLPEPEKYTEQIMPGERGLTLGISGWPAANKTYFFKGRAAQTSGPGDLSFISHRNTNRGLEVAIGIGLHNRLRFTYDEMRGAGSLVAGTDLELWNHFYPKGAYIDSGYRLRNYRLSVDYLTWPYPVKTSRFRLKTTWGVEYMAAKATFDAPFLPLFDAEGNALTDDAGNLVQYKGEGTQFSFLPVLGLGVQGYITPRFSIEGTASGFTIPHHVYQWDAEGAANIRLNAFEVRLGFKAFAYRSSPQVDFWLRGRTLGPFIGIRWHSDSNEPIQITRQ